jgi:hypothetical protein
VKQFAAARSRRRRSMDARSSHAKQLAAERGAMRVFGE